MPERGDVLRSHDGFALTLRAATKDDLDDITGIHIAGFAEEPDVPYLYPFRHQYPEDHWKWTREKYESYLEQPQKFSLSVVDAPSEADGRVVLKPFGLAAWDLAVTIEANVAGMLKCPHYLSPVLSLTYALSAVGLEERRDANKTHCKAYRETTGKRWERHFSKYGEDQVNLAVLVIHPDVRHRGVGTMLVNWGIKLAERKAVPVTVFATPTGESLYAHLKFKRIGTEVVQADGEEESISSGVMVLEKTD